MESVKKLLSDRKLNKTELFVHHSPPKLLGVVSATELRKWLRGGTEGKLERAVLNGQGQRLLLEAETLPLSRYLINLVAKCKALHAAVERGSLLDLQELLESDYNRNKLSTCCDEAGVGLLHKAVYYNYTDIVEYLVKYFQHLVHQRDSEGRIALHYTAACHDEATMASLLEGAGASRGARDAAGRTLAHYRLARTLLVLPAAADMPTRPNPPGLVIKRHNIRIWCHECDMGRLQRVIWDGQGSRLLSEVSNQPIVKKFLEAVPYMMNTIKDIHNAVIQNDLENVIRLTNSPVPSQILSSKDVNNMTVFHKAAGLGHCGILKYIIERYPQGISEQDNEGRTPLHYAAIVRDDQHTFKTLIGFGADEGAVDNKNKTPAYYINRPQELDRNSLKVLPEAPRTPSSTYPSSWDWKILDTEYTFELNKKPKRKNFKTSSENISSKNTLSESTENLNVMKNSSTHELINNLPELNDNDNGTIHEEHIEDKSDSYTVENPTKETKTIEVNTTSGENDKQTDEEKQLEQTFEEKEDNKDTDNDNEIEGSPPDNIEHINEDNVDLDEEVNNPKINSPEYTDQTENKENSNLISIENITNNNENENIVSDEHNSEFMPHTENRQINEEDKISSSEVAGNEDDVRKTDLVENRSTQDFENEKHLNECETKEAQVTDIQENETRNDDNDIQDRQQDVVAIQSNGYNNEMNIDSNNGEVQNGYSENKNDIENHRSIEETTVLDDKGNTKIDHSEDDDDVQVQGNNGRNSQESLIEGIVSSEAEKDSQDASVLKQNSVHHEDLLDNEIDPEVTELINTANMEMLATLVLNGEGARLIGRHSDNLELQSFLENVPAYMQKINRVHITARDGNISELQSALDRRKFAIARDPISANGATPLHVATVFGKTNIIKYLGGRFPETLSAVDFEGRTALHYAAVLPDNGHYYHLLQQLGSNSKDLDDNGRSADDYYKDPNLLPFNQLLNDFGISNDVIKEMFSDRVADDRVSSRRNLDIPEVIETLHRCYQLLTSARSTRTPLSASSNKATPPLVLGRFLKKSTFELIKTRITKLDHDLFDVIWPAVKKIPDTRNVIQTVEEDFPGGVTAPDYYVYDVFSEFLTPLIKDLHNINISYDLPFHPPSDFIRDTAITNSLHSEPLVEINVDPTEELLIKKGGNYYTLNEVLEKPSEISATLAAAGLLISLCDRDEIDDYRRLHGRHWPYGRGVYLSDDRTVAAWINVHDHLRVIVSNPSDNPGEVGLPFSKLSYIMTHIHDKLDFAWHDRLGHLSGVNATDGHLDIPIFHTEEGRYLAKSLGDPLIKGLTEVANVKPKDPIAFLATFLHNFPDHEKPRLGTQETNTVITKEDPEIENELPAPNENFLGSEAKPISAKTRSAKTAIRSTRPIDVIAVDPQQANPDAPEVAFSSANRDEHGQSMLHFAAARTHTKNALFQLLQETDVSIGYRDELYRTARDISIQANVMENTVEIDRFVLHLAARGNTDKIMELLMQGYDHILDVVDDGGAPITEVVSERDDTDMSNLLASIPTFEESRDRLHGAVRRGDLTEVQQILSAEGGQTLARSQNSYGRTPLHVAVLAQNEDIVSYLAESFPELLKTGDNLERTPLHYAMGVEKMESLSRILIRAGAKRVLKDLKGRQPTYYFMNKSDILRLKEEEEMY
ncbi:unnamed protein product [Leptosia nina]|uniref:Phosphagen kinase N-terminal domain-containing protein n=1 Tax=Leptosia nina TaxID=320188 RepID=A0AAV1K708_9NEOP